jgi:protein SCO1/2
MNPLPNRLLRRIRWLAYGLIAVAMVAVGAVWLRQGDFAASVAGVAVPGGVSVGGPFALTDDHGRAVTDASFRGRWMLIYFGYTFCPDVCPTELQTVSAALDKLGGTSARLVPLLITIDPARDTPAALADYVKLFDDRLVGLTGTDEQIATVAREYRVYYARATSKDATAYLMDHSSFLYLIGPDGKFQALFRPGTSPDELANAIRARIGNS